MERNNEKYGVKLEKLTSEGLAKENEGNKARLFHPTYSLFDCLILSISCKI